MNSKSKTLVIAHRGANNLAPENTLTAFELAIKLGAEFIEFDVRKTKDNELVINHDPGVIRTTHRFGLINHLTLKDVKSLTISKYEKIPTLKELLQETKGKIQYMCEVKVNNISEGVIKILSDFNVIDSTILISFKHNELLKSQKKHPNLKYGAIIPSGLGWIKDWFFKKSLILSLSEKNFFSVNAFFPLINKKFVNLAHEKGLKVFAWTITSRRKMKKMIRIGVDGILSNNVNKLKMAIRNSH
jgi:glycerophosphoryl diester phosphodiesterase